MATGAVTLDFSKAEPITPPPSQAQQGGVNLDFSKAQSISGQQQQPPQSQTDRSPISPTIGLGAMGDVLKDPGMLTGGIGSAIQDIAQGAKQLTLPQHVTPNEFGTLLKGGMTSLQQALAGGVKGIQQWYQQNPTVGNHLHQALSAVRQLPAQMASSEQQRLMAGQVAEASTEKAPEPTGERPAEAEEDVPLAPTDEGQAETEEPTETASKPPDLSTEGPSKMNVWQAFGIQDLADHIIKLEGGSKSGPAEANNNPGNLVNPKTGKFQKFSSWEEGKQALLRQLESWKSRFPDWTIEDFNRRYAPDKSSGGDNPDGTEAARNRYLVNAVMKTSAPSGE